MNVIGFDFGTTNSLISVVRGDQPINFLDEENRPIPSVVCYEGSQKIVGKAAKKRLTQAGLGVHDNIVRSPKMYLGQESVFIKGVERSPIDIVADVVRHVFYEAKNDSGRRIGDVSAAVVTIPVDMEGRRRQALRDAFRRAGLSIVQFVHEPLAALYGLFRKTDLPATLRRYDRKLILVFDWGGGTLDLTLCRVIENGAVQLMNDGTDEVGGDVFDETIMNRLVQRVRAARDLDETTEPQPGAEARLLDGCERAKIDLSSRSKVSIYIPSFFRSIEDEDFDAELSQEDFEAVVKPLLDKGFKRIEHILQNAGYSPEQVALCVATGGMSNMPVVQRRLHELFGLERVNTPDGTATLIAEGAAWIASDQAGLRLAKNVELLLARNSYLPLVKARTVMPKEGEVQSQPFHLYCTDPRDGVAKFQICTPKRADEYVLPNEPRTPLENLTVKVDEKARAFQERLELDIRITDDLILEAYARSLNAKEEAQGEIHNLEFGLEFPTSPQTDGPTEDSKESRTVREEELSPGSLTIRANIAKDRDLRLVPGEFLHKYDLSYFHPSRRSPQEQVDEYLYYQPCAICGRASNDPLCKCDRAT